MTPAGAGDLAPRGAHEAAARIRALCQTAQTIAQLLQAQVMEALWTIRREIPDDGRWREFVARETPIDPERAQLMVDTWAVARRKRDLRELAQSEPSEALALVQQSIDAGVTLEDAADEDVVRILAESPRRRHGAIRQLVERQATSAGLRVEARLRRIESERDEAQRQLELERKVSRHPSARQSQLVSALEAAERNLAELAMDAVIVLDDDVSENVRNRILSLADTSQVSLDRIAGSLYEGDGPS